MSESDERGICGKCGEEYEPYTALIPKDTTAIGAWMEMRNEYEWFCPDCLSECPGGENIAVSEDN